MTEKKHLIERVSKAIAQRRRDLIGQPFERVYDELAEAAIDEIRAADNEAYKDPDWV